MAAPSSRDETRREPSRVPSVPNIPQGKIGDAATRTILQALSIRAQSADSAPASPGATLVGGGGTINQTFLLDRANHTGMQTASTIVDLAEVVASLLAPTALEVAAKQDGDPALTALANLGGMIGVVELVGDDEFAVRPVGASAATDLLSRADGDTRYVLAAQAGRSYFPTGW